MPAKPHHQLHRPRRRVADTAGYLMMVFAGVASVVSPAPSVQRATSALNALIVVWSTFLILGGLLAAVGAWTDRWFGELTGLPLLAAVFLVYAIGAGVGAATSNPTAWAITSALAAIGLLLLGRWREVQLIRRQAMHGAGRDRRGGG